MFLSMVIMTLCLLQSKAEEVSDATNTNDDMTTELRNLKDKVNVLQEELNFERGSRVDTDKYVSDLTGLYRRLVLENIDIRKENQKFKSDILLLVKNTDDRKVNSTHETDRLSISKSELRRILEQFNISSQEQRRVKEDLGLIFHIMNATQKNLHLQEITIANMANNTSALTMDIEDLRTHFESQSSFINNTEISISLMSGTILALNQTLNTITEGDLEERIANLIEEYRELNETVKHIHDDMTIYHRKSNTSVRRQPKYKGECVSIVVD